MKLDICLVVCCVFVVVASHRIGDYVANYELTELKIDALEKPVSKYLSFGDEPTSDSETQKEVIRIRFRSHGRSFDLLLYRCMDPVNSSIKLEIRGTNRVEDRDFQPNFYETNDEYITAYGYLAASNLFTGIVISGNSTYYIETAGSVLGSCDSAKLEAFVYKDSDVDYSTIFGFSERTKKDSWFSELNARNYRSIRSEYAGNGKNESFNEKQRTNLTGSSMEDLGCQMEVISDNTFYELQNNDYNATASMLYLHVKVADRIFRNTKGLLPGNGRVRVLVGKIVIFTSLNDSGNPFSATSNISQMLNEFTTRATNYCLSACICARIISGKIRILGLSYEAMLHKPSSGGICALPHMFHGEVVLRNKLIVTARDWTGSRLPLAITLLSFAHELGHSFGSDHDPSRDFSCSPGGRFGHYLMSSTTHVKGHLLDTFSPCSQASMHKLIAERRSYCLSPVVPVCGNAIREGEEECDCGSPSTCEVVDKCCTPQGGFAGNLGCTFRRDLNYSCSFRDNPCCTGECHVRDKFPRKQCYCHEDCCVVGFCDGKSRHCSKLSQVADGTPCKGGGLTCRNGLCSSSHCQNNGFIDCACFEQQLRCRPCCMNHDGLCVSAHDLLNFTTEVYLPPGTTCDINMQCDGNGKCLDTFEPVVVHNRRIHLWLFFACAAIILSIGFLLYIFTRKRKVQSSTTFTV